MTGKQPMDTDYLAITDLLLRRSPPPPLMPPQVYDPILTGQIDALSIGPLVKAGLHLWNDDLDHAHILVQALEGDPTADYWHAIIHRREGDWSNAGYWFRRVGEHPVLMDVYEADLSAPAAFVARCRRVGQGRDADLEIFQVQEMTRLLEYVADA